MSKRRDSKRLFVYYFRLIAREAGVQWDGDNDSEIGAAVDMIFGDMEKLEARIAKLEADSADREAADHLAQSVELYKIE